MASQPYPQTNVQWERHIRAVAQKSANVVITDHVQVRMVGRNVLISEVFDCLRHGSIVRPPRKHPETGNLVCRMEFLANGRVLTVAVDVEGHYPQMVVTVTVIV